MDEPITLESILRQLRELREEIIPGQLSSPQISKILNGLPRIKEDKLVELGEKDSVCPICFNPFLTILTEEEMALAMDSPAHPVEELGVTRLDQSWQCGHLFCRRDISKWVTAGRDSCPMCRRLLIEAQPEEARTEATAEAETQYARAFANIDRIWHMIGLQRNLDGNSRIIPDDVAMVYENFDGSVVSSDPEGVVQTHEDDRQEYSGMYS